jgi:hypothetical protein
MNVRAKFSHAIVLLKDHSHLVWFGVCCLTFNAVTQAGTLASDTSPYTLNNLVALEATQESLAGLVLSDPSRDAGTLAGHWVGSLDANGWNLNFSGTWGADAVTVNHSGSLNVPGDFSTWTYTGLIAGDSFSGQGRIDYDPRWWSVFLKGVLQVVVYGAQTLVDGGTATRLVSKGVVYVGDKIIDHYLPEESEITPPPSNPPPTPPSEEVSLIQSKLIIGGAGIRIDQVGTYDSSGSISFMMSVSPVPEPSTTVMLISGMAVLAWISRRNRASARPFCQFS